MNGTSRIDRGRGWTPPDAASGMHMRTTATNVVLTAAVHEARERVAILLDSSLVLVVVG